MATLLYSSAKLGNLPIVKPFTTTRVPPARGPAYSGGRDIRSKASSAVGLKDGLSNLDRLLEAEDDPAAEAKALQLVQELKDTGTLKAFGNGHQVPKRSYTLEDLRLNRIDPKAFLSPEDKTLNQVRTILQGAGILSFLGLAVGLHWQGGQILQAVLGVLFILTADQIGNGGGFEALIIDACGRVLNKDYAKRVASHEAGHFLVAYLTGLLPKKYILSSVDAYKRYRALNVQAGTQFCDQDYQREVASGKLTSSSLDRYCCIALSGVATEAILFGQAEGGLNDIQQLDGLLRALRFSQAKADDQIRFAVLNVTEILRRHKSTHARLAESMAQGKSIGDCIAVIEAGFEQENTK